MHSIPEQAIACAADALECCGADEGSATASRVKALFRRASAYVGRGDASNAAEARADLERALQLQPDNGAARALLAKEFFK